MNERTTDEELMVQYLAGNAEAFNELFARYKGRVQAYLIKQVRDAKVAEDLFQQVFAKLHKSRALYDPERLFPAWLFSICRNVVRDHFRAMKRRPDVSEKDVESIEAEVPIERESSDLDEVLALLSDRQRQALRLRFEEDLDFDLMARKMNTTQENVRQILSRTIRMIRERLK